MRRFYIVLAWIIAGGVVVQAAAIAFGFGGMVGYVQEGGVVDKALDREPAVDASPATSASPSTPSSAGWSSRRRPRPRRRRRSSSAGPAREAVGGIVFGLVFVQA